MKERTVLLFREAYTEKQREKEVLQAINLIGFEAYKKNKTKLQNEKLFREFKQNLETYRGSGIATEEKFELSSDMLTTSNKS